MKKPINKLLLALCLLGGLAVGGGLYTFVIADGFLMMTPAPEACSKCHIMSEQYDSWAKGDHARSAGCVDCHLPGDNLVAYWSKKAYHGLKHGYYFTKGGNPPNLEAAAMTHSDVNANCARCHADYVAEVLHAPAKPGEKPDCINCHVNIGHLHN